MKSQFFSFVCVIGALSYSGCADLSNYPSSPGSYGGYGNSYPTYPQGNSYGTYRRDPYYGGSSYGNNYDWRAREEQQRLERERQALEEERRQFERERRREERRDYRRDNVPSSFGTAAHVSPSPAVAPPQPTCPSGFSPASSKCSDKERKSGCRDTRGAGGQLCVDR